MSITQAKANEVVNKQTKQAWEDNWNPIPIQTILEIFEYPRVRKLTDVLVPLLEIKGKILEAGCGLGPWVIYLADRGYDIVGVDYQSKSLKKIKEFRNCADLCCADVRNLPFRPGSFDTYLSFGVIEHFPEGPQEALKEASSVLKKQGTLILTVPLFNIFKRISFPLDCAKDNAALRALLGKKAKVKYYQRYFNPQYLKSLLEDYGFSIERMIPIDHIFGLVEFCPLFRKKGTYDRENDAAFYLGNLFARLFPWLSAGSVMYIAHKK